MEKVFTASNEVCDFCSSEYMAEQHYRLIDLPNGQEKTDEIHKILHEAIKVASKPCVVFICRSHDMVRHKLCEKHLYQMIDAIKEYEEKASEHA